MTMNSVLVLLLLTVAVNIRILLPQRHSDYDDEEKVCDMTEINTTSCDSIKQICTLKLLPTDTCIWWNSSLDFGKMSGLLLRNNSGTCKDKCTDPDTCVKCGEFLCEPGQKCVYFKGFPQKCEEPKDTIPDWLRLAEFIGNVDELMDKEKDRQYRKCCEENCVSTDDAERTCTYNPPELDSSVGNDLTYYDLTEDPEIPPGPNPSVVYNCMNNGVDNSECCKDEGVPDKCVVFCNGDGNITKEPTEYCNDPKNLDEEQRLKIIKCAKAAYKLKDLRRSGLHLPITKQPSDESQAMEPPSNHISSNDEHKTSTEFTGYDDGRSEELQEDMHAADGHVHPTEL